VDLSAVLLKLLITKFGESTTFASVEMGESLVGIVSHFDVVDGDQKVLHKDYFSVSRSYSA